jgi:acetylornithine deacetylase/succinyl-diaminopimelate desuccinylase-like protein
MAGMLADLVSIPIENPPGRCCSQCVDLLRQELHECGFEADRIDIPGPADMEPRAVLIAGCGGAGETLYFHGHYDVVPASRPELAQLRPAASHGSERLDRAVRGAHL